jgi:hypothetical protein
VKHILEKVIEMDGAAVASGVAVEVLGVVAPQEVVLEVAASEEEVLEAEEQAVAGKKDIYMQHFNCQNCAVRSESIFSNVDSENLSSINEFKVCKFYEKGDYLFHEGDDPERNILSAIR